MNSFWRGTFKAVGFLAVVIAIVLGVLKLFFVDIVTVAHNGMAPTIVLGDQVLVWRGAAPNLNDIVLCRHPQESGRWVISRVALEPGESLSMVRGQLQLEGRRLDRDLRGEVQFLDGETNRTHRMRWGVEEFADRHDHFFFEPLDRRAPIRDQAAVRGYYLLGDNRGHVGEDSRTFGVVQAQDCTGQVFMRLQAAPGVPAEIRHRTFDLL